MKKLEIGEKLELRPYKRNRSVLFEKTGDKSFLVKEDGFYQEKIHLSQDQLKKHLKKVLKREFPRSHKIRVYLLAKEEQKKPFKKL
ncbi:hypothetical protein [Desulfothermus okinawensis]